MMFSYTVATPPPMTTWKRSPLCGTAPEHALHVLETILIDLGCVNQFKAQSEWRNASDCERFQDHRLQ